MAVCIIVLCISGMAIGEAFMKVDPSIIAFDGTVLNILLPIISQDEGIAFVDEAFLQPEMQSDSIVQEALKTAASLMGIRVSGMESFTGVELYSGDTLLEIRPVYSDRQEGRSLTKGFHFCLTPEMASQNLTAQCIIDLVEEFNGKAIESVTINVPLDGLTYADTVSIVTDVVLDDLFGLHVSEVFVSNSTEGLSVLIRFDNAAEVYQVGFSKEMEFDERDISVIAETASLDGGEAIETFYSISEKSSITGNLWAACVFASVEKMPDKINLSLYGGMLDEQEYWRQAAAELLVDISAKSVSLP